MKAERKLALATVAASLLLSLWAWWSDPTPVNRDGAIYINAAHYLALGDWTESYRIYPWPFYPALLAGTAWLGGMGLEGAGLLLNCLFHALLVWAFLALLRVAGADLRVLAVGALLILVHPELGEDRGDLLRGPGMWAFFLLGVACLMRLREGARLAHALGWSAWLLAAALFRIEAFVYLAVMPLLLLFEPGLAWKQRPRLAAKSLRACLACYLLPGLALAGAALGLYAAQLPLGRLTEPLYYAESLVQALAVKMPERGEALTRHVLHDRIDGYGTAAAYGVLGFIALMTLVKRAGLLFLLLAGWQKLAAGAGPRLQVKHGRVFLWLALVNLAYLLVDLAVHVKVHHRYAAPLGFIVLVYASFGLPALWDWLKRLSIKRRLGARLLQGALALALLATALDGVHSFGASKRYLRDAGEWLASELPAGRRLISNDYVVSHYAGVRHTYDGWWAQEDFAHGLERGRLDLRGAQPGDYLAIRPDKAGGQALAQLAVRPGLTAIRTFTGDKGRQVVIYHLGGL